jgi:polar amino acid transport system substrate-binding protein
MGSIIIYKYITFISLFWGVCSAATAGDSEPLLINTEEAAPFNMVVNDELTGYSTEVVKQALAIAGIPYHIAVLPWRRAYQNAIKNDRSCIFSAARIPARETSFKWIGPLIKSDWVAFDRRDSPVKLSNFADLKSYRVGSNGGSAQAALLRENGIAVDESAEESLNLNKLLNGRIDYWVTMRSIGFYEAARQGVKDLRVALVLGKMDLYLACNKTVANAVVDRLNGAIRQMSNDGELDRIAAKYR